MSDALSSEALPTAQALAAAQLALLRRLAEIGLELAEGLRTDVTGQVRAIDRERQALEAEGDVWTPLAPLPVFTGDIGLVYARITRAVRLTLALQTRILRGLAQLPVTAPVKRSQNPSPASRGAEDLASRERLTDPDDLASLAELAFSDAVDLIRRDLGLPADGAEGAKRQDEAGSSKPPRILSRQRPPPDATPQRRQGPASAEPVPSQPP